MSESNNKKPMRGKLNIVTYSKSYVNFEDGIKELCGTNSKIFNIFKDHTGSIVGHTSAAEVYKRISELMSENLPNPDTRENTLWEFKVSAANVHVKTNQFLSFGWKFKPVATKEGLCVTFFVTIFGKSEKEVEELIKHGFEEMK